MRRGRRATGVHVVAAMLAAAAAGRSLDALGVLPGVHETTGVRAGPASWSVALVTAAVVGALAAARWSRTGSVSSTAAVAVPGQLAVFFAAEAAARLTHGLGALDPDGLVGAGLQAALAVVLLLALATGAVTALRCAPLHALAPPTAPSRALLRPTHHRGLGPEIRLIARGPPRPAV